MGKGAREGNTYGVKGVTGKTISLYLPPEVLPAIKKQLGSHVTEAECIKRAKEYALEGIHERIGPSPLLDQLRFMVSNWQAMVNHAEVFAPELLQNDRWIAMKTDLERRTDAIGVTEFIRQIGDQYRQQIEEADDDQQ